MTPDVSIVMPAYNAARYIADALRSLQTQSGVTVEIVVVDDGSTDGTLPLVEAIARTDPRVVVVAANHGGVSRARNIGIDAARGTYLSFLDSDDLCPPGKIARQVARLDGDPDAEFILGEMLVFEALAEDGSPLPGSRSERVLGVSVAAALFRRSIFERHGNFDPSLDFGEDLDLYLRLIEAQIRFIIEGELATLYRRHQSNTTNDFKAARRGFVRVCHKSLVRRRANGTVLPQNPIFFQRHEIEQKFHDQR